MSTFDPKMRQSVFFVDDSGEEMAQPIVIVGADGEEVVLGDAPAYDFNVKAYGAKGDSRKVTDAVITSANGGKTVTSATANFTAADVGKIIWGIETATGELRLPLGTITARASATSITVSVAATGSYTGISLVFGSDDSDAIRAACAAAKAAVPPAKVVLPPGGYIYSKLLFDLDYPAGGDTISIEGAGPASTIFYMHPGFDMSTTSAGHSTILRADQANLLRMRGFAIDPSKLNFDYVNSFLFGSKAHNAIFEDVHIMHVRGSCGFFNGGQQVLVQKCRVEDGTSHGYQSNEASITYIDCYTGNVEGYGLLPYGIGGPDSSTYMRWIGGTIDECGLSGILAQNSTDVTIVGAKLYGPVGEFAAQVDATSKVTFIGCELVPFGGSGNGNRSALQVQAGGVAVLSCTKLARGGTGVALDNAGSVIDAGGNSLTGTVTGTGTITRPQLSMT